MESLQPQMIESSPHDTAHIPLTIKIEPASESEAAQPIQTVAASEAPGISPVIELGSPTESLDADGALELLPDIAPASGSSSDLPRRGWRSAIQEGASELQSDAAPVSRAAEPPANLTIDQSIEAPVVEAPIAEAPIAEPPLAPEPPPVIEPIASEAPLVIESAAQESITQDAPFAEADIDDVLGLSEPASSSAAEQNASVSQMGPEIIASTEPTPESALDLPAISESIELPLESSAADLTDTTFGRSIAEFEGESLGPIIETPDEQAASIPEPTTPPAIDTEALITRRST